MIISSTTLYSYKLPLVGTLKLKKGTFAFREGLILKLTDDQVHTGWGEAAPLPGFSNETFQDARSELLKLVRYLKDVTFSSNGNPLDMISRLLESQNTGLSSSARFAAESALLSLIADEQQTPAHLLLSPTTGEQITLNALLTADIADIQKEARRLLDRGFSTFKLKVSSSDIDRDIKKVSTLRDAIGPACSMRLDANRSWSEEQALYFTERVAPFDIEYIEEPLVPGADLRKLIGKLAVPVALDETLAEISCEQLGEFRKARAVILKPTLHSGLIRTLELAQEAVKYNMKVVFSSSFESSVGTAVLCHLASAVGTPDVAMGLATSPQFRSNLHRNPSVLFGPIVSMDDLEDFDKSIDTDLLSPVEE